MPTRYLKPGIRDSEVIDRVSPMAECLFYRLLVTVDDFGRTDARPAMLKAACFPIKESVSAQHCEDLLRELFEAGLVLVYDVAGKPYLQLAKWENAPRAKESKHPAPVDGCAHVYASACTENRTKVSVSPENLQVYASACNPRTVLPVTVTVTETETETETETVTVTVTGTGTESNSSGASQPAEKIDQTEVDFAECWAAYPKRPGASRADSLKAYRARIKAGADPVAILAGVKAYAAFVKANGTEPQFIKQPATFFGPGEHFLADWTPKQSQGFTVTRASAGHAPKYAAAAKAIFGDDDVPAHEAGVIDV